MAYWFYFSDLYPSSSNAGSWNQEVNITNPPLVADGVIQGTPGAPFDKLYMQMQYDSGLYSSLTTQARMTVRTALGNSVNMIRKWSYSRSGYSTQYENTRNGISRLIRTSAEITNAGMLKVGSVMPGTTISGKYKLKYNTVSDMNYGGSDIPVSYQVNGQFYDHFIFPCWYSGFNQMSMTQNNSAGTNMFTISTNKKCFGGYRTEDITEQDFYPTFFTAAYNDATFASGIADAVFDFGTTPQEVPQFFVDWINTNFDGVYENTYTVRDPDGNVLASINEAPPMTSAQLSVVGDHKTLTLTGINNSTYTLQWDSVAPEQKQFSGLSYSVAGSVTIPVGTTSVSWQDSTTLWERFIKYVPPATTFSVALYQCTAENNRVDKTSYLTAVMTLNGALREECSILSPVILIESNQVPTANYARIQIWNRYYFITGIRSIRKNLWELSMRVDPLMSYKTGINALSAIVDRNENNSNVSIPDPLLPSYPDKDVEYYEFATTAMSSDTTITNPYIMVVVGGST